MHVIFHKNVAILIISNSLSLFWLVDILKKRDTYNIVGVN